MFARSASVWGRHCRGKARVRVDSAGAHRRWGGGWVPVADTAGRHLGDSRGPGWDAASPTAQQLATPSPLALQITLKGALVPNWLARGTIIGSPESRVVGRPAGGEGGALMGYCRDRGDPCLTALSVPKSWHGEAFFHPWPPPPPIYRCSPPLRKCRDVPQ